MENIIGFIDEEKVIKKIPHRCKAAELLALD